jgi:hypothetical protein
MNDFEDDLEPIELKGEYWFDESGNPMYADGDIGEMNHEMYVIKTCAYDVANEIGLEWDREFWPSSDAFEDFLRDEYSDNEKVQDFLDDNDLESALLEVIGNTLENKDKVQIALDRGSRDKREYAIEIWGWSRVHGTHIEVKTLNSKTLQTIATGIWGALEQEGNLYTEEQRIIAGKTKYIISTYTGRRYEITLDEMDSPENIQNLEPIISTSVTAAGEQLRDLDIKSMNPYYQKKGVIGDSFKRFYFSLFPENR